MQQVAMVPPESVVQGRRRPLHATLAERLQKARQNVGLSARKLSAAAGLSVSACSNIERGNTPAIEIAERLAQALRVSPCCLAYGVEGEAPPPLADGALRSVGCAARLAQLRQHRGLSLRGLGDAAELSATAIQNIETGDAKPSVATIEQLARALGCSPCWLAFGEGADPIADPGRAAAEASAVRYRPPRKPSAPRRRRAT